MRSKLIIEFPEQSLTDSQNISFNIDINGVETDFIIHWHDSLPVNNIILGLFDIITESNATFTYPFYDAINYQKNLDDLDWAGLFSITRADNIVTILSNVDNLLFTQATSNNNGVVLLIANQTGTLSDFDITNVVFTGGDCDNVTVEVTTNSQPSGMVSPFILNTTTNPFTFSYLRGQRLFLEVINSNLQRAIKKLQTPYKLFADNISTNIISTPSENTVTIKYEGLFLGDLVLEYSLDNLSYSSDNVFILQEGSYTAYVRDQFNCVVSKEFEVINRYKKKPIFSYSKINSIRSAYVEDIDYFNTYPNDENTLSCEVLDAIKHKEVQKYQTDDIIPTQILTNYSTLTASIIKEDNTEIGLTVDLKRQFLDIKDYRDCIIYDRGIGKSGVYFDEGKTYDYTTGHENGSYLLNGSLPFWMRVGSFIELDSVGQIEIISSVYDEEIDKYIIEVDYNHTGLPLLTKVKTIYDKQPYNVYEYNADFVSYNNEYLRIKTSATDDNLPTINMLSEVIEVKEKHLDCLKMDYWSDKNSDTMKYETGIKHRKRLLFKEIKDNPTSSIELHKGDTHGTVTESTYYEGDTIIFCPLTKEQSKSVELGLLHRELHINDISYKSLEIPEKEKKGESNLYEITANLIKDGAVISQETDFVEIGLNEVVNAPSLISSGTGFISYE